MSTRTDAPGAARGPHVELAPAPATADRHAEFLALAAAQQAKLREAWDSVNAQAEALRSSPAALKGKAADLRAEVAALDARATNARAALRQLELAVPVAVLVPAEAVSLLRPADPTAFLADLTDREAEVRRSENTLGRAREELERHAAALFDDRLVVADQVAALSTVRERWRQAESQTLDELEAVARELAARESALEERERRQADDDAARLARAQDLWLLHLKLEAWQSALAVRDVTLAAREDALQAEVVSKREHLERWEASLSDVARQWSATRKQELWQLRGELDAWADARTRHKLAVADAEVLDRRLRAEVAAVGAKAMALEGKPGAADRRTRVLQKKWERHFRRYERDLQRRRADLDQVAGEADDRLKQLTRAVVERAEQHDRLARDHEAATVELLARRQELEARATERTLLDADGATREAELSALRRELERLAGVGNATPVPLSPREEIVALVPVGS